MYLLIGDSMVNGFQELLGNKWHVECLPHMTATEMASSAFGLSFYAGEEDYEYCLIWFGKNDIGHNIHTSVILDSFCKMNRQTDIENVFIVTDKKHVVSDLTTLVLLLMDDDISDDKIHLSSHGKRRVADIILGNFN